MAIDLLEDENQAYQPIDLLADEQEMQQIPSQGFFSNALDYEKGLGLGLLQGGGKTAASIGNFPADIYEHFSGTQPYHIPHPNLQKYYPQNIAGKIGSSIGENIGEIAFPGTGTFKAIKSVNNPLVKSLVGMLSGGLSNAASNEENRIGSGITGVTLGGGAPLVTATAKAITNVPWTKGIASKALKQAQQLVGERGIKDIHVPADIFKEAKDFLPKNLPSEKLLEAAKKGDYKPLFTFQSDLGKSARELLKSSSGADRLHGMQAHDLRDRLLNAMKEHFSKQGHEDISNLLTKGQKKYAQHMKYIHPVTKDLPKKALTAVGLGTGYEFLKHIF